MMFELLLDVMDRFLNLRDTNAAITPYPTGGSFRVALFQALRAWLLSCCPSGTKTGAPGCCPAPIFERRPKKRPLTDS
jgi:hypothetical protein